MEVVSNWPVLLAGLSTAGLAGAWWWVRHRPVNAPAARTPAGGKESARRGDSRSEVRRKPRTDEQLDTLLDWEPTGTRVLTTAEREAYQVLRKALPEHMVLAQVPVARFIKVPKRNSYGEWLRRVGSLCADLVICDMTSQVVAVVEVRQPHSRENERAQRRHARMDRVLKGAQVPVHVWLEGALPGAVVAREAILGAAAGDFHQARRDAEAAAVVASLQAGGSLRGVKVNERTIDVVLDEVGGDAWETTGADHERREPPPSTWFDDLDTEGMPLDAVRTPERV